MTLQTPYSDVLSSV